MMLIKSIKSSYKKNGVAAPYRASDAKGRYNRLRARSGAGHSRPPVNLNAAHDGYNLHVAVHRVEVAEHRINAAAHTLRVGQLGEQLRRLEPAQETDFGVRPVLAVRVHRDAPHGILHARRGADDRD